MRLVVLRGGLRGGMARGRTAVARASGAPRMILATGRYLGEGFDDPRLDTLFLTMPIAWRGTLTQYVGRLHRDRQEARGGGVRLRGFGVPVLARMATRRQAGYRALGSTRSAQLLLASSPSNAEIHRYSASYL